MHYGAYIMSRKQQGWIAEQRVEGKASLETTGSIPSLY